MRFYHDDCRLYDHMLAKPHYCGAISWLESLILTSQLPIFNWCWLSIDLSTYPIQAYCIV